MLSTKLNYREEKSNIIIFSFRIIASKQAGVYASPPRLHTSCIKTISNTPFYSPEIKFIAFF